jgi:hypothetical protein
MLCTPHRSIDGSTTCIRARPRTRANIVLVPHSTAPLQRLGTLRVAHLRPIESLWTLARTGLRARRDRHV